MSPVKDILTPIENFFYWEETDRNVTCERYSNGVIVWYIRKRTTNKKRIAVRTLEEKKGNPCKNILSRESRLHKIDATDDEPPNLIPMNIKSSLSAKEHHKLESWQLHYYRHYLAMSIL